MKVYIVNRFRGMQFITSVAAVFSTREKAEAFLSKSNDKDLRVEEHEMADADNPIASCDEGCFKFLGTWVRVGSCSQHGIGAALNRT
jgi:hypothetical protein